MNRLILALAVFFAATVPSLASDWKGDGIRGVATVIDGDTIEIRGDRIRLHGIDAPESAQTCTNQLGQASRCGQQAALALADRIGRRQILCMETDIDRYGRIVAECSIGDENLNRWMVRKGWAVAYRQYSTDYIEDEAWAQANADGIWASEFDMPWDWRRGRRSNPPAPQLR